MKYYIYGGAFNPPTIAHQQITEQLIAYAGASDSGVIILPSGNRSDKTISTPIDMRLGFLEAMIADANPEQVPVLIEPMELYRGYEVQTFDTAQEMNLLYPQDELVWVFGSDSFNSMPEWDHGTWLIENLSILIIERPGCAVDLSLYSEQEKISLDGISGTSSTGLRQRISTGEDYSGIVGSRVHHVLQSSSLSF